MEGINSANEVLTYKGPMNIHVRTFFANFLKVLIDDDYKTSNRLFKIFIELTQNVAFYSARQNEVDNQNVGVGQFILNETENYFNFTTINQILAEHQQKLRSYCQEINSLDIQGLRAIKREKRKLAGVMDVGAHIGLIHVGILSGNPLVYDFENQSDDFYTFTITAQIDKY